MPQVGPTMATPHVVPRSGAELVNSAVPRRSTEPAPAGLQSVSEQSEGGEGSFGSTRRSQIRWVNQEEAAVPASPSPHQASLAGLETVHVRFGNALSYKPMLGAVEPGCILCLYEPLDRSTPSFSAPVTRLIKVSTKRYEVHARSGQGMMIGLRLHSSRSFERWVRLLGQGADPDTQESNAQTL